MLFARRLTALRIAALIAILASAVLTADHVRPGREFCPLEEACSAAAESELGSISGIPTSVLGLAAFGAILLITLLPVTFARRILQPACFVGALAGMGLIAYQFLHLEAVCPLCLVVDGAAIVLGYIALTWPPLPFLRSGLGFSSETASARTAWALGMALTVLTPFAWPREVEPAWEDAPELADALFEDAPETGPSTVASGDVSDPDLSTKPAPTAASEPEREPEPPTLAPTLASQPTPPAPETPDQVIHASIAPPPTAPSVPDPKPTTTRPVAPPSVGAPTPKTVPTVRLVEYLNAFCAHCRATHKRLDEVITREGIVVKRRRVYTWSGKGYPLWARACAYAETVGREEAMFRELTRARRESRGEVYAAARRAGLDTEALQRALGEQQVPARLLRDRGIARAARLKKLPTFDIGRRRLSGSQSTRELRAALYAAKRKAAPANG